MRFVKSALLATTLLSTSIISAKADVNVIASIKPVHSLVAAVMEGVGTPDLIVEGAGSPHTYALKPSQAQKLEEADLVFWIGHEIESFLEKPLEAIATKAKAVKLIEAHDLVKLKLREGGAFDEHDHGNEKEHGDNEHHDHKEHSKGHKEDKNSEFNAHVWLDPANAKALVHEIEEALVEADPKNAAKYETNAKSVSAKLDGLISEITSQLAPVKGKGFVVFHDAYQNFENRFGLSALGSITVSPEVSPGAERISKLQAKVKELNAKCVFSEPQFKPKLVLTVTEGTQAKTGVLDPLGALIQSGPDHYFELIRNMASSFKTCLSQAS